MMPNSTVKPSQLSSHSLRPNRNIPARVTTEYTMAAMATTHGRLAIPVVSSRQAKEKKAATAGHTPTFGSFQAGPTFTILVTAS